MTLADVMTIKLNDKSADFWIDRKGEPSENYKFDYHGVTITDTDKLYPKYAYYLMQHLYTSKRISKILETDEKFSTKHLKLIRIAD